MRVIRWRVRVRQREPGDPDVGRKQVTGDTANRIRTFYPEQKAATLAEADGRSIKNTSKHNTCTPRTQHNCQRKITSLCSRC